jgi:RNA polymerase sigma-70 factor (ECF subfamily)
VKVLRALQNFICAGWPYTNFLVGWRIKGTMEANLQDIGPPAKADFHAAIARRSDSWYAACLRITRSPELADDAVQDALLSAWHKRHQFESSALLETWIHRIAVNAALQLLRKNKPERSEPLSAEPLDGGAAPLSSAMDAETQTTLAEALTHLSEMERLCFVLKHLEQWRLNEIAEQLATNVGVVKQSLFRAVNKLRVSMAHLRG